MSREGWGKRAKRRGPSRLKENKSKEGNKRREARKKGIRESEKKESGEGNIKPVDLAYCLGYLRILGITETVN